MLKGRLIIEEDLDRILAAPLPWHGLAGKTILVTGANGFLPAYMIETLLRLNTSENFEPLKVVGLVRNIEKAKRRFREQLANPALELIVADIGKPVSLDDRADYIIHAASQASPRYFGSDPVGTLAANTLGTFQLLQFAATKSVTKFLFFSSSEIYGAANGENNLVEDDYGPVDPMQVRSCYAESKRMGETMCVAFCRQYGVPVAVVRPFHTYGPGLALDDGRVFADFVANILRNENIVMNSDGAAVRSFCYLADATIAFFTVLLKGENAAAYNVGDPGNTVSIRELARLLVSLFPEKNLEAVFKDATGDGYMPSAFSRLCPSIEKIQALGWSPATPLADGFRRTIASFTE